MLNPYHAYTPPTQPSQLHGSSPSPSSAPPLINGLTNLLRSQSSSSPPIQPSALAPPSRATSSSSVPASSAFPASHATDNSVDDTSDLRSSSQPLPPPNPSTSSSNLPLSLHNSSSDHSFTNHSRTSTNSSNDLTPLHPSLSSLLSSSPLSSLTPHLQRLIILHSQHQRAITALQDATAKRKQLLSSFNASSHSSTSSPPVTTDPTCTPPKLLPPASSPLRSSLQPHSARIRGASLERSSRSLPTSSSPSPPPSDPLLSHSVRQFLCHVRFPSPAHPLVLHSHVHRFKTYPNCFTGSSLVDWMIAEGWANDRREAVEMGRVVMEEDVMVGVGVSGFEDGGQAVYRWKEVGGREVEEWRWAEEVMEYGIVVNSWKEGKATLAQMDDPSLTSEVKDRAQSQLRRSVVHLCTTPSHWKQTRHTVGYTRFVLEKRLKKMKGSEEYTAHLTKTVSLLKVSPATFLSLFMSSRTRKRVEPLFQSAHDVLQLSPSTRLLYLTTSPLLYQPCDAVVYQDHFTVNDAHIIYEVAIQHPSFPPVPSHLRVVPLLSVKIARPQPNRPDSCELTVVTQIDPPSGVDVSRAVLDKWGGHGSATALNLPEGLDVLSSSLSSPQSLSASFSLSPSLGAASPSPASPSMSNSSYPPTASSSLISIPSLVPLAVLGRGAYSKILQVYDPQTHSMFAMKVMRKSALTHPAHYQHVLLEQSILSRMDHPFICRLYYAFQSVDKLYMVMSYAAGGDLFTLLRRRQMNEGDAALYAAELVLALRYLHRHGIVHRDVKPENVLIDAAGHLVLVDFGLSAEQVKRGERTFSVSGTSEYLAPEMISGGGHDQLVDFWQLGIVLCEMMTGKHPFYHRNLYRLQQNILHRTPHFDPALSPEARSLLHALLAKDPNQRLGRVPPRLDHNGVMVGEGDVEGHPFFAKHRINWVTVESRQGVPGWVPELKDEKDVSHFDSQFTGQTPSDTPESFTEKQLEENMRRKGGGGGRGKEAVQASPSPALQGGYAFYTAGTGQPAYDPYTRPVNGHVNDSYQYHGQAAAGYSPKGGGLGYEGSSTLPALPPPLSFAGGLGTERSQSPSSALTQQLAVARQQSASRH